MAKTERVGLTVRIEGLDATLKAFNRLDKDAKNAARDEAKKIAELLAGRIRSAAPPGKRYQNIATTVRASRDRVPVVYVGGRANPRVSGGGGPRELIIGMEFGADQNGPNAWRFPPRTPKQGRGNAGYWIYPTLRANQAEVVSLWAAAIDRVAKGWSE
jgi:hypothetical protein